MRRGDKVSSPPRPHHASCATKLRSAAPAAPAGGPRRGPPRPGQPHRSGRPKPRPGVPRRRPSPDGKGWYAGPGGRSRPGVPLSCYGSSSPHSRPARHLRASRLSRVGCRARPLSPGSDQRGGCRRWRRPPPSLPAWATGGAPACPPAGGAGRGEPASSLRAGRRTAGPRRGGSGRRRGWADSEAT